LNILREDWKPVLDINAVIYGTAVPVTAQSNPLHTGLIYLFYEPNPDDPLNRGQDFGQRARKHLSVLLFLQRRLSCSAVIRAALSALLREPFGVVQ